MKVHLVCRFEELKVTFCKCYRKVQIDEQVYVGLQMIKQSEDNKVEISLLQKWGAIH